MFWKKRATIDAEEQAWLHDCWRFLDSIAGPVDGARRRELILPGRSRFPDTDKTGHAKALHYFELTQLYSGLQDRPFELVAQPKRMALNSVVFGAPSKVQPLGTYQQSPGTPIVSYDADLLNDPIQLVATFAHELAHDLVLPRAAETPGGEDLHELATDLATVHMGFGLFGANAAFEFQQYTDTDRQGWRIAGGGYLSEAFWSYANALFVELLSIPVEVYAPYVKSRVADQIARNRAYLKAHPGIVARLRSP